MLAGLLLLALALALPLPSGAGGDVDASAAEMVSAAETGGLEGVLQGLGSGAHVDATDAVRI
jgi:hypothetical protein